MGEQLAVEAESPYDKSVCITAVTTAKDTFERISVTGSAPEYIARVYDAIDKLQDIYVDSDGEFTNGKAPIGGVLDINILQFHRDHAALHGACGIECG